MLKTIFSRASSTVYAVGRMTVFCAGLAVVVVGLTVGVASVAEARIPSLKLGVSNTVKALTSMVGSVAGPVLRLDNSNAGEGATALDLLVEQDKAPLTVNPEAGTATNLSADELDGKDSTEFLASDGKAADSEKLDGQDSGAFAPGSNGKANDADKLDGKDSSAFMPASVYRRSESVTDTCTPGPVSCAEPSKTVICALGDQAIGGGFDAVDVGTTITGSHPAGSSQLTNVTGWTVSWHDDSPTSKDTLTVYVVCANF